MKTDNNKALNKMLAVFVSLFVVICCNVLYKKSLVDLGYLLVVIVYFGRYLYIKKKGKSIS